MESRRTRYGHVLRLDGGEEIIQTLGGFAAHAGLRAGLLSGLGAVGEVELGFFVRSRKEYVRQSFRGEYEIASLTGNLSELDGRPFPHCHIVISDEQMKTFAGHLFRGVVTVTCEVQIVTDPEVVRRVRRPELGFNPLALGPATP